MRFSQWLNSEQSKALLSHLMEWAEITISEASWPEKIALDAMEDPRFQKWLSDLDIQGEVGKPMEGGMGRAYPIGDFIIKFTTDRHEADAAAVLVGQDSEHSAKVFGVNQVSSFHNPKTGQTKPLFAIIMEKLNTDVGKRYRVAGGADYGYMDRNNKPITDLNAAYQEIIGTLPKKYQDQSTLKAVWSVLQSVNKLHKDTGVLTQDTHGGNMAFKGRNPAYFDFGRSQVDFNHPATAGKRIGRFPKP